MVLTWALGSWHKRSTNTSKCQRSLIDASELDTKLIMRSLRNTERVLNNKAVEEIVNTEKIRNKTKFF